MTLLTQKVIVFTSIISYSIFPLIFLISSEKKAYADCTQWHPHHCSIQDIPKPKTEYRTNKFDLKNNIENGGWTAGWADDISETDAAQGVVAAGVSIYSGSPAPFAAWVYALVDKTISSLGNSISSEYRDLAYKIAENAIYEAVSGKKAHEIAQEYDTLDIKAGAIKYSGGNYVGGTNVAPTWGLKPYVAIRIRSSQSVIATNKNEIENVQSGLCLDVRENKPGGNVVIDKCEGASLRPYQVWKQEKDTYRNVQSDLCLDVREDKPGGNVVIDKCEGASLRPYQVWKQEGDTYRNVQSDLCLDVREDKPGGNVVIDKCEGSSIHPYQVWR